MLASLSPLKTLMCFFFFSFSFLSLTLSKRHNKHNKDSCVFFPPFCYHWFTIQQDHYMPHHDWRPRTHTHTHTHTHTPHTHVHRVPSDHLSRLMQNWWLSCHTENTPHIFKKKERRRRRSPAGFLWCVKSGLCKTHNVALSDYYYHYFFLNSQNPVKEIHSARRIILPLHSLTSEPSATAKFLSDFFFLSLFYFLYLLKNSR